MTPSQRSAVVREVARGHGFDRCGIAALGPIGRAEYFRQWLAGGRAGSMAYLHRRADAREDPSRLLAGLRSAIVVAVNYYQPPPPDPVAADGPRGRVALYAWGEDYHRVVAERLEGLLAALRPRMDEEFAAKVCVDTSPLIERELAAAAGIGWIGKNTLVLHPALGSYFFLGEVLTTLELEADEPLADHCGRCTRCLEACPTGAFPAAYEMDARRCISYLTIEHRGEIDAELAAGMGDWIFGCDVCQQVCPFNRDPPRTGESRFAVRGPGPMVAADEVRRWDDATCRAAVRGTAGDRATPAMWRRNAEIVVRNAHRRADRADSGATAKG